MKEELHNHELLVRIQQLERRCQRLRQVLIAVVAAGLLLLGGWAPIEAVRGRASDSEQLQVGPEDGFSIVLEGGPDAARIATRGRDGRPRSLVELTDSGIVSRILDRNGQGRFDVLVTDRQIGALGNNEARLKISSADGKDAILLATTSTNQGLVVVDPAGDNQTLMVEVDATPSTSDIGK